MSEPTLHLLVVDPAGKDASALRPMLDHAEAGTIVAWWVADIRHAVTTLGDARVDAVVITADQAADQVGLMRLRGAAADAALVVMRADEDDRIPLAPQDVGIQSTLDVWTLDERTLRLTLDLAVERRRLARAQEQARIQSEQLARLTPLCDPLTGLPHGERLLEEVDRHLADAIRFARSFSVAVVEVEGLDQLRADRGDAIADSWLIHVSGVMTSCLRAADLLGRLVDGQFLIAMPGTDGRSATLAAQRIQGRLDHEPYKGQRIVVSIGVAPLRGLMSVDELVFTADNALGVARSKGAGALHLSVPATTG